MRHREVHRSDWIGWLRAAVLGANDGIVSTASLVVGVAAAEATRHVSPLFRYVIRTDHRMLTAVGDYATRLIRYAPEAIC